MKNSLAFYYHESLINRNLEIAIITISLFLNELKNQFFITKLLNFSF